MGSFVDPTDSVLWLYLVPVLSTILVVRLSMRAYVTTSSCISGQRRTTAKSMYEEHLCVVALTSIELGTQFFPLASYFLV